MKCPTQFLVAHRISCAVNAGSRVITLLKSHCGICDYTAIVHDPPESIVNVGEKFCGTAGLNVLHLVAARPRATLVKISDHTDSMTAHLRRRLRLAFSAERSDH